MTMITMMMTTQGYRWYVNRRRLFVVRRGILIHVECKSKKVKMVVYAIGQEVQISSATRQK
jgi:hypothetical protein